ncbi:hypothetical protein C8J43_11430 [Sphingomonas sp. PP-CE-1G-424]|nr:hypothetical protein C8J43_11430 [Sphingomonas sp. PP-CE-1G-424]
MTRYAELMSYRVQIAPRPIVIDDDGLPVPNSHVLEIIFPTDSIDTAAGPTSSIIGAGIAKILVADVTVRGVGLC